MVVTLGLVTPVLILGAIAAGIALLYFLIRGLRQDHETGEYHFTWGVGIVVLFLLGLAPGFVGLGLYLTVERDYPFYWLALCLLVVLGLGAVGLAAVTDIAATTGSAVFG
jgi:hypothetical protein